MAIDMHAQPARLVRWRAVAATLAALAVVALAVAGRRHPTLVALATWLPALGKAMLVNIGISAIAIAIGTLAGLVLGPLTLSRLGIARVLARAYVQLFRNAPLLVLIYFSTYVFPFEIRFGHASLPFPDWFKVTLGLALPASANFAEIFRGAIQSIPHAQWDAARSLAFSRAQVFRWIILPQCVRRMLPPWMNLYASIAMATALASLVGVHDLLDTAQVASNTVARADFTVVVYFTVLGLFFAYCYPIARFTRLLERRHAFH
ncbi:MULTISPECIES: amino acid ABC transporter permease [unclassified Burkholderia]|uniref:amino acid ABC transporter permease n=1 Tax=unclassified Burkholderia TaxID=2613784 RepID=UPI000F560A10|nr:MULTISPECIES: amino acid ABC transporter permease [unclassified Burkholderia]RQR46180.1 amino acid ABC transporter permease [Burkholderia sp. Bp9131]RQR81588.1 amino acid ABC transporter permease [Burkholderia sp. Bp9011]RQR91290.1 amino acid ABC transporter permease [Burkholderia sp. Bp9010]RQS05035.1 amino acid ABC transporter permease [Burkholderia sp. Bp8991]RQS40532.1 amino acid ABC transporter permease [Burkholderia sp. Bp8990]